MVIQMNKKIIFFSMILFFWLILFMGDGFSKTIIDKAGRHIEVSKPFTKIISLYGAHTENLFYLGADKQIIGISINDKFPPKVNSKKRFSYHDDAEKFIGADPDLIIIRPMIDKGYHKLFTSLEKLGITIISLQPSSTEEMFDYWLALGALTGKNSQAEKMVKDFKKEVEKLSTLTSNIKKKKKVYFEAIHKRMKTFTRNSMPGFVLKTAGGINIAIDAQTSRNSNIANYGKEKILSHGAEIDIFLAQKGVMNNITREIIKNEPGFKSIKAVANGKIYLIDEQIISRPVFRLILGIKTIGHILYPDIYKNIKF